MTGQSYDEEKIVVGMFDRGLLGFPQDGITLKSGRLSPYYYNDRPSLSFSSELDRNGQMSLAEQRDFRKALAVGYAAKLLGLSVHVDHVFGKAQAATAPAAVGAYEAGLSYLWERVEEPDKSYGIKQKIEGSYEPGEQVALADDVVTDGKSKDEAAQVLREVGLEPVAVTIKFDREEGGMQALDQYGFEANAVTGLTRAVPILRQNGRIGQREVENLIAYHEALKADGGLSTFQLAA